MTLKGIVVSKFGSATKVAKMLNWSGSKARRILRGEQLPTMLDIEEMAVVLGINSMEEFIRVFFPRLSTKWMLYKSEISHEKESQNA
jgi:hypothetical protein